MPVEVADPVAVDAVRHFNRFYTRAIGVLEKDYLGTPYTVAEGRVLYEIAIGEGLTPKTISETTGLDAGYLSRIVGRLERDGLVGRTRSDTDGRSIRLRLTPQGVDMFVSFNSRSSALVENLIEGFTAEERARLVTSVKTVEALMSRQEAQRPPIMLRHHQPGDMGWVTERHAMLYGREYDWGAGIESLTARICADFLDNFDAEREHCWIAERGGERLGSVFLVKENDAAARLRLLMLEPAARGNGLGRRLVDECIVFARAAGYREIVLWTHAVLLAARRIYAATGFQLEETWTHDDFGQEETGETWRLKL